MKNDIYEKLMDLSLTLSDVTIMARVMARLQSLDMNLPRPQEFRDMIITIDKILNVFGEKK